VVPKCVAQQRSARWLCALCRLWKEAFARLPTPWKENDRAWREPSFPSSGSQPKHANKRTPRFRDVFHPPRNLTFLLFLCPRPLPILLPIHACAASCNPQPSTIPVQMYSATRPGCDEYEKYLENGLQSQSARGRKHVLQITPPKPTRRMLCPVPHCPQPSSSIPQLQHSALSNHTFSQPHSRWKTCSVSKSVHKLVWAKKLHSPPATTQTLHPMHNQLEP
jgi:hypothetical protein